MFHHLAGDDMIGRKLRVQIPDGLAITTCAPKLTAIQRLKNYSSDDINLDLVDGMYVTNYYPAKGVLGDDEMRRMLDEMAEKLQSVSSPSTNEMFDSSVANYALTVAASGGFLHEIRLG